MLVKGLPDGSEIYGITLEYLKELLHGPDVVNYSKTPLIRTLVIRKTPIIRIGLDLQKNLSRILQN